MSSIEAYDDLTRIKQYDADMDVMHPDRHTMVNIAIEFYANLNPEPTTILDLGCGTGFVAKQLAEKFPQVELICLDGAANIISLAKSRLKEFSERLQFHVSDFKEIEQLQMDAMSFDAMFSSYALHHLAQNEKVDVLNACCGLLKPGGHFFNADLIRNEDLEVEQAIQNIRINGILDRASSTDERFASHNSTRVFLDTMENAEGDQPLDIETDLATFREAGFHPVSMLWLMYREAVICARKRDDH